MKKAKKLITISIVLLTFCVSAYATGDVHDGTAPSSRTGTGHYTCRTIAPLNIYVDPPTVTSDELIFAKGTSDVTYTFSITDPYLADHLVTVFAVVGEPDQQFYSSVDQTITGGISYQTVDGVTLEMQWTQYRLGSGYNTYNPTNTTYLSDLAGSPPAGRFSIYCKYLGITIAAGATAHGVVTFEQTVTVSYDPFGGGGGGGA